MKYIDLHCDTLTACRGGDLETCGLQVNLNKLKKSECAAQCFAVFTQGDGAALCFGQYLDFFRRSLKRMGEKVVFVRKSSDFMQCFKTDRTGVILTVENLGFIGNNLQKIDELAVEGVRMASLVWNEENCLAYPNYDVKAQDFSWREVRGLKPSGRAAAEILDSLGIIIDISHLSDGGAEELLTARKIPLVASHSNAVKVCGASRNLTDLQIKKISDCGGVMGINFFKSFLGEGDTFDCVLKHIRHVLDVGGEDVVAFGSDFDGIPATKGLEDCLKMPYLLNYLNLHGIKGRVLEKLCYKNFLRVFKAVCG